MTTVATQVNNASLTTDIIELGVFDSLRLQLLTPDNFDSGLDSYRLIESDERVFASIIGNELKAILRGTTDPKRILKYFEGIEFFTILEIYENDSEEYLKAIRFSDGENVSSYGDFDFKNIDFPPQDILNNQKIFLIESLEVAEPGKGFGSSLITEIKKMGFQMIILISKNDEKVIRFWESNGFKTINEGLSIVPSKNLEPIMYF
jgi:hypothetical protein